MRAIVLSVLILAADCAFGGPLPDCLSGNFSQAQVEAALSEELDQYSNAQFEEWEDWFDAAASRLGCEYRAVLSFRDGFEALVRAKSANGSGFCELSYCSGVSYCGPDNSLINPGLLRFTSETSDNLNRFCYQHDQCYRDHCVSRLCNFAGSNNEADSCDRPIVEFCTLGTPNGAADLHVCAGIKVLRSVPRPAIIGCSTRTCDMSAGLVCAIGGTGECISSTTPGLHSVDCGKYVYTRTCTGALIGSMGVGYQVGVNMDALLSLPHFPFYQAPVPRVGEVFRFGGPYPGNVLTPGTGARSCGGIPMEIDGCPTP